MGLVERRNKVKQSVIAEEMCMAKVTIAKYFQGKLNGTATARKIAKYLDKVHKEEIKGLLSSTK